MGMRSHCEGRLERNGVIHSLRAELKLKAAGGMTGGASKMA